MRILVIISVLAATLLWWAPTVAYTDDLDALNARIVSLKQEGKFQEAIPLAEQVLRLTEAKVGPDHPSVAMILNNLALLYSNQGRYAEAEPLFKRSLAIQEKAFGPDHPAVVLSLGNLATLYRRSELVLADIEHLTSSGDGSGSLYLPTSKTDQEGNGSFRYLAPDTMQWLLAYLKAAGHTEGPLFRAAGSGGHSSDRLTGETVARTFKQMAKAAGIEPSGISGHSTRIGKAQDCASAGIGSHR